MLEVPAVFVGALCLHFSASPQLLADVIIGVGESAAANPEASCLVLASLSPLLAERQPPASAEGPCTRHSSV